MINLAILPDYLFLFQTFLVSYFADTICPVLSVDDFQNTSSERIYALGDVCGQVELTPMAIAAGRRLADRYFHKISESHSQFIRLSITHFQSFHSLLCLIYEISVPSKVI